MVRIARPRSIMAALAAVLVAMSSGCSNYLLCRITGLEWGELVYVANSAADNISAYEIVGKTGYMVQVPGSPFGAGSGPASLASNKKYLYAANNGESSVSAYSINAQTGGLVAVQGSPFATGKNPSKVVMDGSGAFLYVANYGGWSISAFAIDQSSGALSQVSGSPYSLGTYNCPADLAVLGNFLYVTTEGEILTYQIDASTGALTSVNSPVSESGESLVCMAAGGYPGSYYLFSASDSNIWAFSVDLVGGQLTALSSTALGTGGAVYSMASRFNSSGSSLFFLYAARWNNGAEANQGNVDAYSLNTATGALSKLSASPFENGIEASGICVLGAYYSYVFTTNYFNATVHADSIDPTTGALTPVSGSPFSCDGAPEDVIAVRLYE